MSYTKQEEVRERIERLLKKGKTLFYSDIASELNIDLEVVVDICNELQREGKVEVNNEYIEPLMEGV